MCSLNQLARYCIAMTILVLGPGLGPCPDSYAQTDQPQPFYGMVIESEDATPFQINALIGEIDRGMKPNLVVGEELILITTYQFEGKVQQTHLFGINENPIELNDLKKGHRVEVVGFQLPDKTIVGHRIQIKKPMKSDPKL